VTTEIHPNDDEPEPEGRDPELLEVGLAAWERYLALPESTDAIDSLDIKAAFIDGLLFLEEHPAPRITKIYFAAAYSRKEEMREKRDLLEKEFGYHITSRWIDQEGKDTFGLDGSINQKTAEERGKVDYVDIMESDICLFFTDVPSTTGGFHTEFGIGLVAGKNMVVIGPRLNVFQALPSIFHFPTWELFVEHTRSHYAPASE
jgi:hypothetical protein